MSALRPLLALALVVAFGIPSLPMPAAEAAIPPFATVGEVELVPVSDKIQTTGFHQAGAGQRALDLTPARKPTAAAKAARPAPEGEVVLLPSRGRGTGFTTAVDLAVPAGAFIASPVTGTVKDVADYRLYGRSMDRYVVIAPAADPDVEVWVMHLDKTTVTPGDRVTGGSTVIARTARTLPFPSQIERYSGAMPHVHVDVRATR